MKKAYMLHFSKSALVETIHFFTNIAVANAIMYYPPIHCTYIHGLVTLNNSASVNDCQCVQFFFLYGAFK